MGKIKMNEQINKDWESNLKDDGLQKIVQELIYDKGEQSVIEESKESEEQQIEIPQNAILDMNYKRGQRQHFLTQENEVQEPQQYTGTDICEFIRNYQNHHLTKTHKYRIELSQDEYYNKNAKKCNRMDSRTQTIEEEPYKFDRELLIPSHFEQNFIDFKKQVNHGSTQQLKRAKTKMFAEKLYKQQSQTIVSKIKELKQKYNYEYLDMNDKQLLFNQRKVQYNQLNLDKKYDFFQGQTNRKYDDVFRIMCQIVNGIENYKRINNMYVNENQSEFKVNKALYNHVKSSMTISEMDNIMDLLLKDMSNIENNKKKNQKQNRREYEIPKQRIVDNVLKMIEDMEL